MLTLLRPDDRSPEERMRDAYDDYMETAREVLLPEDVPKPAGPSTIPLVRISIGVCMGLFGLTLWNVLEKYSVHTAGLMLLSGAWGICVGILVCLEVTGNEST